MSTSVPFPEDLSKGIQLYFEVKKHTKFKRIISRIQREFQEASSSSRRMIFHGIGLGCEKCIACVEMLKRSIHCQLFQWNILRRSGMDPIFNALSTGVNDHDNDKFVPEIFIMLSRDPYPAEHSTSSQQVSSEECLPASYHAKGIQKKHVRRRMVLKKSENKWKRPSKLERSGRGKPKN